MFFLGYPNITVIHFMLMYCVDSKYTIAIYNDNTFVIYKELTEITSTTIPNKTDIAKLRTGNTVNSISDNVFSNCNNLTDIIINGNNTIIGENAFENCNNISKIKIGDLTLEEISQMPNYPWGIQNFEEIYSESHSHQDDPDEDPEDEIPMRSIFIHENEILIAEDGSTILTYDDLD